MSEIEILLGARNRHADGLFAGGGRERGLRLVGM